MADRRRRRVVTVEKNANENIASLRHKTSECESECDNLETENASEYGSGTEDDHTVLEDGSDDEADDGVDDSDNDEGSLGEHALSVKVHEIKDAEYHTDDDDGDGDNDDDDGIIGEIDDEVNKERCSGDGAEQAKKETVDDDEDQRNPAYVPRKGAFYEHDSRTGDDDNEGKGKDSRKKLWQACGKWSHDRYQVDYQRPKTARELIGLYGYDIRTSDKPPELPPMSLGRGRGRNPRQVTSLSEYINKDPPSDWKRRQRHGLPPPSSLLPQVEAEISLNHVAVIDTSDSVQEVTVKSIHDSVQQDDHPHVDSYSYMATIDTNRSSANHYWASNRARRGDKTRSRYQRTDVRETVKYHSQNHRDHSSWAEADMSKENREMEESDQSLDRSHKDALISRQPPFVHADLYSSDITQRTYDDKERAGVRGENNVHQRDCEQDADDRAASKNMSWNATRTERSSSRSEICDFTHKWKKSDSTGRPVRYSKTHQEICTRHVDDGNFTGEFTSSSSCEVTGVKVESGPGRVSAANRDTNISSNSKTNGRPNTQHRLAQHDTDGPSCFIARATSTKSQRNTAVMPSEAGNFDTCETVPSAASQPFAAPPESQAQPRSKRYSSQRMRSSTESGDSGRKYMPVAYAEPYLQQSSNAQYSQHEQRFQKVTVPLDGFHRQQSNGRQEPVNKDRLPFNCGDYTQGSPGAPILHPDVASIQPPLQHHFPQDATPFNTGLLPQNIALCMPGAVTTPMPQHPPMPNVRPVPGHYMPSPRMLYTTPPPAPGLTGPYQMPPSYASAPAQLASSAFGQAVIPPTQAGHQAMYRGGTVYFHPHPQQCLAQSSRRQKVAIPIVDPMVCGGYQHSVAFGNIQEVKDDLPSQYSDVSTWQNMEHYVDGPGTCRSDVSMLASGAVDEIPRSGNISTAMKPPPAGALWHDATEFPAPVSSPALDGALSSARPDCDIKRCSAHSTHEQDPGEKPMSHRSNPATDLVTETEAAVHRLHITDI